ncbi:MAG: AAA family ATPase [Epsilonproteobacteria bacterium]|nr:AAA family ATPase [Campylobacterota bacterium]NPA63663.1 AAA family ATPase [Campylobacterota bacterium]
MKPKKREILQNLRKKITILLVSFIVLVLLAAALALKESKQSVDYATYETMLGNNMIDEAEVGDRYIYLKSAKQTFTIPKEAVDLQELYKSVPVKTREDYSYIYDLLALGLFAFVAGYILYMLRRQRQEPIPIKHQIQIAPAETPEDMKMEIKPQVSDVTFDDVAGIDEVKEELEEIIDFLKNPKKYIDFGVRMPRGVLLVGPPGVGKTLIAKAVAGEAGVPFFYQSGSAFVQIYVGMGAKRVRELFAKAKEMAPSIVFIDEIDAVGKARGGMRNDEREATLNQLLTEMDGFEDTSGVIVIGATNKIEVLDEALLRPGRFDRRIFVSLPNREDRIKILSVYLRKIPHRVDIETLADMTVGFSGAALSSLVNEAALQALRKQKRVVELEEFEEVKEKVLFGKKRLLALSEREKQIQSLYQGAKALSAYWFGVDFDKISIVGGDIKEIDREILSKTEYMAKIKVYLAGYEALRIIYGEVFSNAAQDLKRAKILAEEMVLHHGMGDRIYAEGSEAMKVIEQAREELEEFLSAHKDNLKKIAQILLHNESITKEQIKKIYNGLF